MRIIVALIVIGSSPVAAQTVKSIPLPAVDAKLPIDFSSIQSFWELSDGRIVVTDQRESKIFVCDFRTGKATAVGRHGSGPLEYLDVGDLHPVGGDSAWMPDAANHRWLVLRGGEIVGTVVNAQSPFGELDANLMGGDDAGHMIGTVVLGGLTKQPRGVGDSVLLVRASVRQGRLDTLVKLASGMEEGLVTDGASVVKLVRRDANGRTPIEFPPIDWAAISRDGWIVIVRRNPYRVDWIGSDGKLRKGAPLPLAAEPFTAANQKAYLERTAYFAGSAPRSADSLTGWPAVVPAFTTDIAAPILVSPDGRALVLRTPTAAQPGLRYDVIDRNGGLSGTLDLPAGQVIMGFGKKAVYLKVVDDDGIARIERRSWPRVK